MPYVVDYKEELKRLISETYEPADSLNKEFEKTTEEIVYGFRNILPENAIDDHLVYQAMLELKFEPKENPPMEFSWYFKRK